MAVLNLDSGGTSRSLHRNTEIFEHADFANTIILNSLLDLDLD